MEATYYRDDFSMSFQEQSEMEGFLREREDNAKWHTVPAKSVEFQAIEPETIYGKMLLDSYRLQGKEGLIQDTIQNTQLVLRANDNIYPVRSCAITSIMSRARVSGHALSKVRKKVLAEILNHCIGVASGDALLRLSDDKISAMHGGDAHDYAVLETPALFSALRDYLTANFKSIHFAGGHFDHYLAVAVWEMRDNAELLDGYKEALAVHGIKLEEYTPAIRFATSDVGVSSATIYPILQKKNGMSITLGGALKLEHKNGATMKDFLAQMGMIYPRYSDAIQSLVRLMEIDIEYSDNTLLRVMKRLSMPKKLAYQVADQWRMINAERPCTAHDLYLQMCEVPFLMQCSGIAGIKIAQMEEKVARALTVRWSDYDYPGEVKW